MKRRGLEKQGEDIYNINRDRTRKETHNVYHAVIYYIIYQSIRCPGNGIYIMYVRIGTRLSGDGPYRATGSQSPCEVLGKSAVLKGLGTAPEKTPPLELPLILYLVCRIITSG